LARKVDQLKKMNEELTTQKANVAELDHERESLSARVREQQQSIQKLEQMVERLTDASSGLHGEQELRVADLQRSAERLVHEVAQARPSCALIIMFVNPLQTKRGTTNVAN
jgi:predicted RNase H-like nuclease (RuvC/YqgF family)